MNRRPLLGVVAILLAALALTACNSVIGIGADTFQGRTTIRWLVRTDPSLNDWYKQAAAQFDRSHPKVHVQVVSTPGSTFYDQKYATMLVGHDAADVFGTFGGNGFADNVHQGFVQDLQPYMDRSHFPVAGLQDKPREQYTINGDLYGVPTAVGGSYLFYNIDLLKRAGLPTPPSSWDDTSWTLDTLVAAAKKANDPAHQTWGIDLQMGIDDITALFGADIIPKSADRTHLPRTFAATSAQAIAGAQWAGDLVNKLKIAPNPAQIKTLNGFASGKIAYEVNGWFEVSALTQVGFHWGIAAIPHGRAISNKNFTDVWMMSHASRHKDLAWQFLQFLGNPATGARGYMQNSRAAPAWKQLQPEWERIMHTLIPSMTPEQIGQVLDGSIKYGRESFQHTLIGAGQYDSAITNVPALIYQQSAPVRTTMQDLQNQLNAIARQYRDVKSVLS